MFDTHRTFIFSVVLSILLLLQFNPIRSKCKVAQPIGKRQHLADKWETREDKIMVCTQTPSRLLIYYLPNLDGEGVSHVQILTTMQRRQQKFFQLFYYNSPQGTIFTESPLCISNCLLLKPFPLVKRWSQDWLKLPNCICFFFCKKHSVQAIFLAK